MRSDLVPSHPASRVLSCSSLVLAVATVLRITLGTSEADASTPSRDLVLRRLGLSRVSVQTVRVDSPARSIPVDLGGRRVTLRLSPSHLRSPGFVVQVAANGSLHDVPAPPDRSYRGTVAEMPGSVVGGTFRDGQLRATIALADGRIFHLQPLSEVESGADPWLHAVYEAGDVITGEGVCATTPDLEMAPQDSKSESHSEGEAFAAAIRVAEVAFDTDYEFYQLNGSSVSRTVGDIEDILAQVNVIYERDVNLAHTITKIIVRSDANDPYSATNADGLYDQFSGHWISSQTSVPRDVAHLMTGKNLDGGTIGIASIRTVCNRTQGYGISQSYFSNNLSRRAALTAHELGHNWGARHCDDVTPCYIMCSSLGDCDGIGLPNFEPSAINAILSFASSRTCLTTPPVTVDLPDTMARVRFARPAPNPFTGETALSFQILQDSSVQLEIYDVSGHRVIRLVNGVQSAGWHNLTWNGLDEKGHRLEAGVYYARVRTARATVTQRIVLVR